MSPSEKSFNIAVIAGDGIGKETVPEGLRVLNAVQERFDLEFHFETHDLHPRITTLRMVR